MSEVITPKLVKLAEPESLETSVTPGEAEAPSAEDALAQFEGHLNKLATSMASVEGAGKLADSYQNKGAFTLFIGSFTGTGQQDLARMVGQLAGSLHTTQLALELVMKMQIRKNAVLRDFHDALTRKIENLAADSTTLDANQREAAIFILTELRRHVEEQMAHRAMVEAHDDQLRALDARIRSTSDLLVESEARAARELAHLKSELARSEQARAQALQRVSSLEDALRPMHTLWGKLLRYALPLVSLIVAGIALDIVAAHG